MVVIDLKKRKAYVNLSKTQAAIMLGVSRRTITRWSQLDRKIYGTFEVYFNIEKFKQRPGPPPRIDHNGGEFRRP